MKTHKLLCYALTFALIFPILAQAQSATGGATTAAPARTVYTAPKADLDKIMDEGLNRSQVMEHISYLTDVIGPRLTNSPNLRRAGEWARDLLAKWGASARLEPFGPWGRGWSLKSFQIAVTEPAYKQVLALPSAWSPSTPGPVSSEIVFLDIVDEKDFEKYKGKLKGKIVMISPLRELKNDHSDVGTVLSDGELAEMANYIKPQTPARTPEQADASRLEFAKKLAILFKTQSLVATEDAAVLIENSQRGSGGAAMVHNAMIMIRPDPDLAKKLTGVMPWMKEAEPYLIPTVTMANEDYNLLARQIRRGLTPKMTVDIQAQYHDEDPMAYNTIAEIPGTDPQLKDEIVMFGAHLDSWHAGSGATDNAAGSGVVMEALRILLSTGLKPRRTVRLALWSGEEQGLHGSKAYVEKHFAQLSKPTREVPKPQPVKGVDYDKLSVYFNLDNGAGKIRGIYLMDNGAARPIFEEWFKPFHGLGAKTTTMMNKGSSDHMSFDSVGLPGFGFIQDPLNYNLDFGMRTHHTNQDTLDHIQADHMKQAATIMAAFVYQAAMMDEKMPRKAPKP